MLALSERRWEEHQRNKRPHQGCCAGSRSNLCTNEKIARLSSAFVYFRCFCWPQLLQMSYWPSRSFPASLSASCAFSILLLAPSQDEGPQVEVTDNDNHEDNEHDYGEDDGDRISSFAEY